MKIVDLSKKQEDREKKKRLLQKPKGYPAIPECSALTYFGISVSVFVSTALWVGYSYPVQTISERVCRCVCMCVSTEIYPSGDQIKQKTHICASVAWGLENLQTFWFLSTFKLFLSAFDYL